MEVAMKANIGAEEEEQTAVFSYCYDSTEEDHGTSSRRRSSRRNQPVSLQAFVQEELKGPLQTVGGDAWSQHQKITQFPFPLSQLQDDIGGRKWIVQWIDSLSQGLKCKMVHLDQLAPRKSEWYYEVTQLYLSGSSTTTMPDITPEWTLIEQHLLSQDQSAENHEAKKWLLLSSAQGLMVSEFSGTIWLYHPDPNSTDAAPAWFRSVYHQELYSGHPKGFRLRALYYVQSKPIAKLTTPPHAGVDIYSAVLASSISASTQTLHDLYVERILHCAPLTGETSSSDLPTVAFDHGFQSDENLHLLRFFFTQYAESQNVPPDSRSWDEYADDPIISPDRISWDENNRNLRRFPNLKLHRLQHPEGFLFGKMGEQPVKGHLAITFKWATAQSREDYLARISRSWTQEPGVVVGTSFHEALRDSLSLVERESFPLRIEEAKERRDESAVEYVDFNEDLDEHASQARRHLILYLQVTLSPPEIPTSSSEQKAGPTTSSQSETKEEEQQVSGLIENVEDKDQGWVMIGDIITTPLAESEPVQPATPLSQPLGFDDLCPTTPTSSPLASIIPLAVFEWLEPTPAAAAAATLPLCSTSEQKSSHTLEEPLFHPYPFAPQPPSPPPSDSATAASSPPTLRRSYSQALMEGSQTKPKKENKIRETIWKFSYYSCFCPSSDPVVHSQDPGHLFCICSVMKREDPEGDYSTDMDRGEKEEHQEKEEDVAYSIDPQLNQYLQSNPPRDCFLWHHNGCWALLEPFFGSADNSRTACFTPPQEHFSESRQQERMKTSLDGKRGVLHTWSKTISISQCATKRCLWRHYQLRLGQDPLLLGYYFSSETSQLRCKRD